MKNCWNVLNQDSLCANCHSNFRRSRIEGVPNVIAASVIVQVGVTLTRRTSNDQVNVTSKIFKFFMNQDWVIIETRHSVLDDDLRIKNVLDRSTDSLDRSVILSVDTECSYIGIDCEFDINLESERVRSHLNSISEATRSAEEIRKSQSSNVGVCSPNYRNFATDDLQPPFIVRRDIIEPGHQCRLKYSITDGNPAN
jgi:hypothetical protein